MPHLPVARLRLQHLRPDERSATGLLEVLLPRDPLIPARTAGESIRASAAAAAGANAWRVPTLVVHGDHDRIAALESARRFVARATNAEIELDVIAGGHHDLLRGRDGERCARGHHGMDSRALHDNSATVSDDFAIRLPKAELHVHLEGTLEPDMLFSLAERNRIAIPYASVDGARRAYAFANLQSFLDVYYAGMAVLRTERDFFDLTNAYLARARAAGVVHAEIFFDPQAHLTRGLAFETVLEGIWDALRRSEERYGISTRLIMCFLRDRSAAEAMTVLSRALPFGDRIAAVGLDSAEAGNPPSRFTEVFARARAAGWKTVAHAGEEGPPGYVREALDLLGVSRIDHGIRSLEDPALVARLRAERVPLTVCPFSNVRLRVVDRLEDHPLRRMLDAELMATVNSDDPAYFGGYVDDNFSGTRRALGLSDDDLLLLARNSFEASFVQAETRNAYLERLATFAALPKV